jgi:cytochrome c
MKPLLAAGAASLLLAVALPARTGAVDGAPATPARGQTLFKQRCATCHAVSGVGGKVGPDLTRVIGRKAGSTAYSYSAAMKGSKIVWSAATLDKYLAAPTKAVPGTKMVIAVAKPEDRKAIIGYLMKP